MTKDLPGFCNAAIGRVPCKCAEPPSLLHDVHRCNCGGEWTTTGRVVKAPAYPAIAGWGAA